MTDLHIHTVFSPDARCEMEDYIKKAIEMGKKKIGFSEHINMDFDYHKFNYEKSVDLDEYFNAITQMREKYGDKIEILAGGEIGFDNELQAEFCELVAKYPFDYIINSVHLVYGEDAWLMPFYENKTKKQAYDLYLDQVYDSVCGNYPFDIVGHIGYVIRRIPYDDKSMGMDEFGEKIDKILKQIIKSNKALEINTNTRGKCDLLPLLHVIERYIELGGRKFSYGSDAHDWDRLYDQEDKVKAVLKNFGIDKTVCYRNGIEYFENL